MVYLTYNNIQDQLGHGSHVSGTIAADSNNTTGVAGICWDCKIMMLKVFGSQDLTDDLKIYNAIEYAIDNGAKVINLSLEGGGYSELMQEAINDAWDAGVLVVVAAGNDTDDASFYSPAGLDHVITVAATDRNDAIASFSNIGPRVDLTAPGVYILSTWLHTLPNTSCVGDTMYFCQSGTSMSSPHVAGVAALLFDYHSTDITPWTILDVRADLLKSVDDKGSTGFDSTFGFGRLNAYTALSTGSVTLDPSTPTVVLNSPVNDYFSNNITLTGTVDTNDPYIYHLKFDYSGNTVYLFSGRGNVDNSDLINENLTLTEGNYDVTLSAEDFNGTVSTTSSIPIHIDTTPPASFSVGASTSNTSVTLTFTTTDLLSGMSHYEVAIDNGSYSTKTSPYTKSSLSDGSHTAHVKAFDIAGNSRTVDKTFTITSTNYVLETSGDFNHDSSVDLSDLSILASNWNKNSDDGDANHDGKVDLSDLSILAQNWLKNF